MPTLSQLSPIHSESAGIDLLLQDAESRQLEQIEKKFLSPCAMEFSSERKKLAKQTSDKIVEHINEHLQQVSDRYINREKAFANRGDRIFHSHHRRNWQKMT